KCLPISTQHSTYNPRRITTACNYSKNGAMNTVKKKRALGAKTWGAKSQYCHLLPLLKKKREEKESSLCHISPSTTTHPLHHLCCPITPVSSSSTLIQTPKLQILSSAAQIRSSSLMKLCRLLLLLLAVLQLLQLLVAVILKR